MKAPIVEKFEDKTVIVKHVEPVEVRKVIEKPLI